MGPQVSVSEDGVYFKQVGFCRSLVSLRTSEQESLPVYLHVIVNTPKIGNEGLKTRGLAFFKQT
jgi:hypothetical protein